MALLWLQLTGETFKALVMTLMKMEAQVKTQMQVEQSVALMSKETETKALELPTLTMPAAPDPLWC